MTLDLATLWMPVSTAGCRGVDAVYRLCLHKVVQQPFTLLTTGRRCLLFNVLIPSNHRLTRTHRLVKETRLTLDQARLLLPF